MTGAPPKGLTLTRWLQLRGPRDAEATQLAFAKHRWQQSLWLSTLDTFWTVLPCPFPLELYLTSQRSETGATVAVAVVVWDES